MTTVEAKPINIERKSGLGFVVVRVRGRSNERIVPLTKDTSIVNDEKADSLEEIVRSFPKGFHESIRSTIGELSKKHPGLASQILREDGKILREHSDDHLRRYLQVVKSARWIADNSWD